MKSNSSKINWKKFQLRFLQADDISCDFKLKQFMRANATWTYNLNYTSDDICDFADNNNIRISDSKFDFFIINDMEFGKIALSKIENILTSWYDTSTQGGYFAIQSYYFNWTNDENCCYLDLSDNMDLAVVEWVERYLKINNYTNDSLRIDNPLTNRNAEGVLMSGSDFMYTHGNTRFWLWKKS